MSKILIVTNSDIGLFKFRKELVEALIKDYEVHIAVPKGKYFDELIKMGCIIHDLNLDRRGKNLTADFKLIIQVNNIVKKNSPDVVLTYTIKPNIYGGMICKLHKIPYITNVTGLGSALQNDGLLSKLLKIFYGNSTRHSNKVFFQNSENLNFFLKNNLLKNNETLIPGSGVNLDEFKSTKIKQRDDTIRFLFIGRLMEEKGIMEYIDAARKTLQSENNVEFWIIGMSEDEELERSIKKNHQNSIQFLGEIDDVRDYVNEVDCVINPSYHEGMSNVLLEAASMSRPLLASNIPGCKEIIDEGVNGYLFEPKNSASVYSAIKKFVSLSYKERKEMGRQSRLKVEREFDRNIVVNEYLTNIKEILEG